MATCGVWCLVLLTLSVGRLSSAGPPPGQNWENIAIGKSCSMSSTYTSSTFMYFPNNCSTAINDNTSTNYVEGNCIHTADNDSHPYWTVNLGQEYTIHWITIYPRHTNRFRINNVSIWLDGRTAPVRIIPITSPPGHPPEVFDFPLWPPETGREVTLARRDSTSTKEPLLLNICEVQVWVCARGFYGRNCTERCSTRCQNGTCDSRYGNCTCRSYWQSPTCQVCADGKYGVDCNNTCGHCANNAVCNKTSGHCPASCEASFQPPLCKSQCSQGSYGNDCSQKCGDGCSASNTCNPVDGTCSCASDKWKSPMCDTCASGHFTVTSGCQDTCGTGCDDTCDPGNGNCTCKSGWEPPFCNECQDGYYKEGAQCVQCSSNCAARTKCNKDTGKCDGCEAGYHGDKCKLHCTPSGRCLRCDQDTGVCLACYPSSSNLTPPSCTDTAKSEERDGGQQSLVGPVVGSIVGVGLLLTISITAAICWRRRSEENPVRTNNPPIALSDRKTCAPDPPTPASTDARVPAPTADDGLYVEIGGTENTYDKLHPYSNQDAKSQQYTQLASGGRDVDTPSADSAYVNTSLPMGKKGGKI